MKVNMSVRLYGATPELRRWYRQLRTEMGIPREIANLLVIVEMQRVQRRNRSRRQRQSTHVHLAGPVREEGPAEAGPPSV